MHHNKVFIDVCLGAETEHVPLPQGWVIYNVHVGLVQQVQVRRDAREKRILRWARMLAMATNDVTSTVTDISIADLPSYPTGSELSEEDEGSQVRLRNGEQDEDLQLGPPNFQKFNAYGNPSCGIW